MELVIPALLRHELVVRTALHDAAVFQHHDAVRVAHGGEPVRDDKRRAAGHQRVHAALHELLRVRINRGGGLVEDQYRRVGHGGTCNGQQLPLPL